MLFIRVQFSPTDDDPTQVQLQQLQSQPQASSEPRMLALSDDVTLETLLGILKHADATTTPTTRARSTTDAFADDDAPVSASPSSSSSEDFALLPSPSLLKYLDVDGDLITLACEEDWQEAKLHGLHPRDHVLQLVVNASEPSAWPPLPQDAQQRYAEILLNSSEDDDYMFVAPSRANVAESPAAIAANEQVQQDRNEDASPALAAAVAAVAAAAEEDSPLVVLDDEPVFNCNAQAAPEAPAEAQEEQVTLPVVVADIVAPLPDSAVCARLDPTARVILKDRATCSSSAARPVPVETASACSASTSCSPPAPPSPSPLDQMQAKFDDFKRSDFVRRCGESKDSAKEALKETLVELKQLKDQLKQDIKPKAAAVAAAILEALKDFGDFTERQFNAIKEAIAEVLERHDDSSASAAAPAESASDEASSSNNDNSASAAVEALAQAPRNDADADSSRTSKNMNNTNEQVAAQGEESLARPDSVYGREATAPPQEMETFYRSRSSVEGVSTVAPALALIAREASAEGVDARIHKWSHELIRLSEIGFDDVDRNIGLLEECNGDLSLVIQRLL